MLQRSGVILFAALAGCSSFADDEPCACCAQEPGWTPPASDAGARDVSATDVGKDVSPEVGAETLPPLPTSCPEGMVAMPGACMDVYEASREDATEESAGTSEIASSRAGVLPWQPVDLATARAACSAAGKRLCRLDEWVAGCRGPDWTTYSYGDSYDPSICNGIDTYCDCEGACAGASTCPYPHCYKQASSQGDGPCGAAFHLMPTGSFTGCTNEYGLFDINGNVWELADSDDGLEHFRGGAYNCSDSESLHRCDHDGTWGPSARGFRCCEDPE